METPIRRRNSINSIINASLDETENPPAHLSSSAAADHAVDPLGNDHESNLDSCHSDNPPDPTTSSRRLRFNSPPAPIDNIRNIELNTRQVVDDIEEGITEEEIRPTGGVGEGSILEPGQGLGPLRDVEQGQGPMNQLSELRASQDEGETFLDVNNSALNLNRRPSFLNGTYTSLYAHCHPSMHFSGFLTLN